MGAAAEHRGNASFAREAAKQVAAMLEAENTARVLQIAADCNEFARAAWSFIVEPTALRRGTVERSKTRRGWPRRHAALVAAHCAWVGADHRTMAGVSASIARAKAAHSLLLFCLGGWTIPSSIHVPRAAQ